MFPSLYLLKLWRVMEEEMRSVECYEPLMPMMMLMMAMLFLFLLLN